MFRFTVALFGGFIAFVALFGFVRAAPDGGVVGNGTPGSCTDAALTTALAGGGNISFNCGGPKTILVLSLKTISQNTTINGGGVITLTGGLATPLFHVEVAASLALSNITLDSAYNTNSSGGAIWSAGPLTLTNVTVQNSLPNLSNQYCGGALLAAGETLIVDSTFKNNTAVLGGGAICVRSQPNTKVQIIDSTFFGNQAIDPTNGLGGALYVEYGTATVLDSSFILNTAHFGGAAYILGNGSLTMEGSPSSSIFASKLSINANNATEDGGALYNKNGVLSVNHAVLSVNRTPTQTLLAGYGGGIYNEGVLTLTNSIISQNEGRFGGGVFVGNGLGNPQAVIDHTSFLRNISGNLGGGLYTNNANTFIFISNSAFSRNTAVGSGGGLARFNSALHILNASFTQNTAGGGGGLYIAAGPNPNSGPYVRIQNATISDNTANGNLGGGVLNVALVELYSMTIISNTNGVWSGGSGNTRFRDTLLQNPGYLNCNGDGTAQTSDDAANFSTDNSCVLPSSQTGPGLNPMLGPLAIDVFGPTSYYLPLAGSPLINQAFNCLVYDQRNAHRPDTCDIGAVEYNGQLPTIYVPLILR